MRSPRLLALLFCLLINFNSFAQTVVFPGHERPDYYYDVLKQALSYSPNKNYQLKFYNNYLPKIRVFENIITDGGIDIIAAGATTDREKILLPIRFPLVKGLLGWRIPLVHKNNSDLFLPELSNEDFKKISVGQLHTWSDSKILESNNLNVKRGSNYLGLFHMLAAGRFDYFPRSILEVQREFDDHKDLNIAIDSNIILHYPTAYIFYVKKYNKTLADDISFGLEQALKDGSFDKLFNKHFGEIINHRIKEQRRVYHLNNPFLPKKIPLNRKELWLDLSPKD